MVQRLTRCFTSTPRSASTVTPVCRYARWRRSFLRIGSRKNGNTSLRSMPITSKVKDDRKQEAQSKQDEYLYSKPHLAKRRVGLLPLAQDRSSVCGGIGGRLLSGSRSL